MLIIILSNKILVLVVDVCCFCFYGIDVMSIHGNNESMISLLYSSVWQLVVITAIVILIVMIILNMVLSIIYMVLFINLRIWRW